MTYIPITLDELTNVTKLFSTSLEQIEYLAKTILSLQNRLKQYKTNENDDNELLLEMIKFAEKEINNLGGRPVSWLKYPLVTNVHEYNKLKGKLKDEGKLLEWIKYLYNNVERSVEENDGILGWRFNERVLRQAKLDSTEKDEEGEIFSQFLWEALDVEDEFVDHLERQLKTNTDLLPSPPENKLASVAGTTNMSEYNISGNFEDIKVERKQKQKQKPHTAFILVAKTEMKIERGISWKAMLSLAQKSRGQTEVTLPGWGEIYLRRVRLNPENEILYSYEEFDYDKAENLPDGVFLITHKQFDKTWTTTAQPEI
jgi:hypothetical protein